MPNEPDNLDLAENHNVSKRSPGVPYAPVLATAVLLILGLVGIAFRYGHEYFARSERHIEIAGYHWQDSRETLVIAVRSGCRYCQASMPFYEKLLTVVGGTPKGHVRVVFITYENEYLALRSVPSGTPEDSVRADTQFPDWVTGTPTIASVDRSGKVIQVWPGYLNVEQQEKLLKLVQSM